MLAMPDLASGFVLVTAVAALQHEWVGVRENESYQRQACFPIEKAKKELTSLRV